MDNTNYYVLIDPNPPKFTAKNSKYLYARKNIKIWNDRTDTIGDLPSVLQNLHFLQVNSKGHKDKKYSIIVLGEMTIYLGIRRNIGNDDRGNTNAIGKAITNFTSTLDKNIWIEEQLTISADCCKFWAHTKKTNDSETISLPTINTDEFPITVFIGGKALKVFIFHSYILLL